jgi:3',5'-cyclic AMP phosphodiesterase CpdA
MLKLLHISDLHFGPPYLPRVGEALLRKVPSFDADVIVASGDFTQRAKPSQFAEARAFLDRLPSVPLVAVPGNHDVPLYRIVERLFRPHELYQEYICKELNKVHRVKNGVIVALDSTAPRSAITNGRISTEQLEFAEAAFRGAEEGAVKMVVAHHHFAPAPDYERESVMPRAKRAIDRFLRHGVELIMGGHLHRGYIGNSLDIYPGPKKDRGIIIVQSGTTTSRRGRARERERNTFNIIEIDSDMMVVTHYMYFDDTDQFGPMSRHIFPRAGKRFVEPAAKST